MSQKCLFQQSKRCFSRNIISLRGEHFSNTVPFWTWEKYTPFFECLLCKNQRHRDAQLSPTKMFVLLLYIRTIKISIMTSLSSYLLNVTMIIFSRNRRHLLTTGYSYDLTYRVSAGTCQMHVCHSTILENEWFWPSNKAKILDFTIKSQCHLHPESFRLLSPPVPTDPFWQLSQHPFCSPVIMVMF